MKINMFPKCLVLLCLIISTYAKIDKNGPGVCDGKCYIQRVHRMLSADCYNKSCKHFPRHLQSDIEVLDAAYNRIREITSDDLKPYRSLKHLYLGDNMITKIHPDAFATQDSLLTLDLSYNAFASPAAIPDVVFHLPSLKNLYLSQNQNINIVEVIERAAPLTAPLESIDIAFNDRDDEEWQMLPIMGASLPTLIKYNVSGMHLILNTSQFAGLCNLEYLVNTNVTVAFVEPCQCWTLERWLKERGVHFTSMAPQCGIPQNECAYDIPADDLQAYDSCKQRHAEKVYQSKVHRSLLIAGCVVGIVLLVLIVFVWRWRRTRRRHRAKARSILQSPDDAH